MLAHGVASDADGAVLGHILPEVLGCHPIGLGCGIGLEDAFHTYIFRYLRVGMLAIEERRVEGLHAVEHGLMGVLLGGSEVLAVAKELIGIEQRLVHAAMLTVEEGLEIGIGHLRHQVDAPVGQLAEQLLGHGALAIEIGIAQACQDLVLAIEGHPAPVAANAREVAPVELLPGFVDGLSANEAIEALGITIVGILTVLHDTEHIV